MRNEQSMSFQRTARVTVGHAANLGSGANAINQTPKGVAHLRRARYFFAVKYR